MKYIRNGQSSGLLTPVWPMMKGYGVDPYDPSSYMPSAGPNGGYDPFIPSMVVYEEEVAPPGVAPLPPVTPILPDEAPTTPSGGETAETVTGSPTPAEGVLPGAETPEAAPVHPYDEEAPEREHPEVTAVPGGGAPAGPATTAAEYVGGTELGPEAGYEISEGQRPVWPIVVGVGAAVGTVALIALAAFGGKK